MVSNLGDIVLRFDMTDIEQMDPDTMSLGDMTYATLIMLVIGKGSNKGILGYNVDNRSLVVIHWLVNVISFKNRTNDSDRLFSHGLSLHKISVETLIPRHLSGHFEAVPPGGTGHELQPDETDA